MKYIFFFATPSDIIPVLRRFESDAPLKFVESGTFSTPCWDTYLEASQIPAPGIATHETGNLSKGYLVSRQDVEDRPRVYFINSGEKRWSLDNGSNLETVVLVLAGLWKAQMLLPGNMATLHNTPAAQQLMKWFLSALKKEGFYKIGINWLGKEAMEMLGAGMRLTEAEQSPSQYDLKLPAS